MIAIDVLVASDSDFIIPGATVYLTRQTAVVRGTLLAYEHMRKDKGGKGGRIINVSSEYGKSETLFSLKTA